MEKRNKIIYWIATVWLSLGMVSSGIFQLIRPAEQVEQLQHLGIPIYLISTIAIWKFLGVIALLAPRFPLVKEWAYAGFFFTMSGATVAHIAVGDPFGEIFPPILLMVLIVVSWYFRPSNRRLAMVTNG